MRIKAIMTGILICVISILQLQDTAKDMTTSHRHTNRLINATSPYLLQHAHNPVDWYEWGEEALTKAKKEDKPILVSIGYSSCHWCHVMERESFENDSIAKIMNEFFVCIKVDREERPDIDQIYMDAVQAMGINGGWPLNVFLTPDQKPFYGGTYYPAQNWVQMLTNIHTAFETKRDDIESSAAEIKDALSRSDVQRFKQDSVKSSLKQDLTSIYTKLSSRFDKTWGGMDKAPKFVMPSNWLMLLRYYDITKNKQALEQINVTLKRVAMGGIQDQIGGGFARYSTDAHWFAPHFEKMLYDNAQLMSLYAEAYAVTKDPGFKEVTESIAEWLARDMTHPDGGFYSALDADSEGEEGKYYVWTSAELEQILGSDAPLFKEYYSVTKKGNWEHGNNILIRDKTDEDFLAKKSITPQAWQVKLDSWKQKLLAVRSKRIPPGLDDKIITAWNAMMITGLTDAYRYIGKKEFLEVAEKNMAFLEKNLMDGSQLYRSFKGKRSTTSGFLDDYAFMIQAYISLYQTTFNEKYIYKAEELMKFSLDQFYDEHEKFFFYTSHNSQELITRKKEVFDNVIASSNSVMSRNLLSLGVLFDREEWKAITTEMTSSLNSLIVSEPNYMSYWAISLMESKMELAEIVLTGPNVESFRKELQSKYNPFSLMMGTTGDSDLPLFEGKVPAGKETTVFVCYNKSCKMPVLTVEDAIKQLKPASSYLE